MYKILAQLPIHPKGMGLLKEKVKVSILSKQDHETLKKEIKQNDGVINRIGKIPKDIIEENPNLKVIGQLGVGLDHIDMETANSKKIPVVYAPGALTFTVAEHTIALILALAKDLRRADINLRKNNWNYRDNVTSIDLKGKTLGIIGYGQIGSLVAKKCKDNFGMQIIHPIKDIKLKCYKDIDIDEVFRNADFVSIHVPLNNETRGMVSLKHLKLLGKNGYLVNCARGAIVNQKDLTIALKTKTIAGAAIDNYEKEPPDVSNELFSCDNLIATPHIAGLTKECFERMSVMLAKGILDVLDGNIPENIANKEYL